MRGIDRFLMLVLFAAVLGRAAYLAVFDPNPASVRTPAVMRSALVMPPRVAGSDLPDMKISASQNKPGRLYTGTAFALSDRGHWLTATHVVEGCKFLLIGRERRAGEFDFQASDSWRPVEGLDVAIMDGAGGMPGLVISDQTVPKGAKGYFVGYPGGDPHAGYVTLIGRSRMVRASERRKEIADVWALRDMTPKQEGGLSLGGASGGPLFNERGQVVGMMSAGNDRRGRLITSVLPGLEPVQPFSDPAYAPDIKLTPSNYVDFGRTLRERGLVTRVNCRT